MRRESLCLVGHDRSGVAQGRLSCGTQPTCVPTAHNHAHDSIEIHITVSGGAALALAFILRGRQRIVFGDLVRMPQAAHHSPELAQVLKLEADKIRFLIVENGVIVTPTGQVVAGISGGTEDTLFLTGYQENLRGNIFSHNHPFDDIPLSYADILAADWGNVAEIRAVTSKATYRMLKPAWGWPGEQALNDYFDEANNRVQPTS